MKTRGFVEMFSKFVASYEFEKQEAGVSTEEKGSLWTCFLIHVISHIVTEPSVTFRTLHRLTMVLLGVECSRHDTNACGSFQRIYKLNIKQNQVTQIKLTPWF